VAERWRGGLTQLRPECASRSASNHNTLLQNTHAHLVVRALGTVEPGDGMLHPLLVIAVREVLASVRAP